MCAVIQIVLVLISLFIFVNVKNVASVPVFEEGFGSRCKSDLDCNKTSNLVCNPSTSLCECDQFTSVWNQPARVCQTRVNFLCEPGKGASNCVKNAECLPLSSYLPLAPVVDNGNGLKTVESPFGPQLGDSETGIYLCTCASGFVEDVGGGHCLQLKRFGESCDQSDTGNGTKSCGPQRSEVKCMNGTCQCQFGALDQFYDGELERCVSFDGGVCSSSCVPNAACVDVFQKDSDGQISFPLESLGLQCECLPGFEKSAGRLCQQQKNLEFTTDSDN